MRKLGNLEDVYRLSPTQEGMLFQSLYASGSDVYFEQFCYTFKGRLNGPTLQTAWRSAVERHPALRSSFHWEKINQPLQVVARLVELPWQEFDWRELPPQQQEQKLETFLQEDRARGFDLSRAPLIRLTLIRIANDLNHLIISSHHIMCDGWSTALIFTEVSASYDALRQGRKVEVGEPRPYRDYIAWLQRQDLAQAEAFWRKVLKGFTAPGRLWIDQAASELPSLEGAYGLEQCRLSQETTTAVENFAQVHKLTLNTLTQGAWAVLISRYSGDEDIIYGMTVSGRSPALNGVLSMVGVFMNTLPVRVKVPPQVRLKDWLGRLQLELAEVNQYQYTPSNRIAAWSDVPREVPLFQSILVFENFPRPESLGGRDDGLEIVNVRSFEKNNFPLTAVAQPGQELALKIHYDRARFRDPDVRRMLGHWRTVLEGMVVDPEQTISELPWLVAEERQELLVDWNQTRTGYPREQCVHELFEEQVSNNPDTLALVFESEEVTYGELNRRANQLAHCLRELGVGPETLVGLCLERSVEMIVGMLGIIKAGGAYMPLDPRYPSVRLNLMLEEAQTAVVVTEERWLNAFDTRSVRIVCFDRDWEDMISRQSVKNPQSQVTPDNLIYLLYTSGSTGKPKGIGVSHRAVVRLVRKTDYVQCDETDRVAQAANASFDATTFEVWAALLNGAQLVGLSQELTLMPDEFASELRRRGVTAMFLTTALFNELGHSAPGCFKGLRHLLFGGEAVDVRRVRELLADSGAPSRLVHVYGPTESTTFATWYEVNSVDPRAQTVPIGSPIANTTAYVLDSGMRPVPMGVAGELYLGGDGLARGYINSPSLTAEMFRPHPFSNEPGARLYRTGDLVRHADEGNLEFLGRLDDQIKIRGYRVEPGEIETALRSHPQIKESVVVARREEAMVSRQLVAYVVADPSETLSAEELQNFLKDKLPDHLIPSSFVVLDALPLNPNGKVDRNALPAPESESMKGADGYIGPRNATEQALARIWEEVLGVKRVGVRDNFFRLGGDSILSIQIIARANSAGLQITHKQLFDGQTIEAIAVSTSALDSAPHEQGLVTGEVLLTPVQHWFFEQNFCEARHFNHVVLLKTRRALDSMILKKTFERLLSHHDALRLQFNQVDGRWQQINSGPLDEVTFVEVDLCGLEKQEQLARMEESAAEAQASIQLDRAPLLRIVCFNLGPERLQRLLIVIHHLVIDAVSWRILLEDLELVYLSLSQHREFTLPAKTTSFKEWSRRLTEFAQSSASRKNLPYWLAQFQSRTVAIPVDYPQGENTQASLATVSISLSVEETRGLLQDSSLADRTQINELLLAALAQAFSKGHTNGILRIDLEGHGREEIIDRTNLSRTIGWFTSIFPVLLDLEETADARRMIKLVKKRMLDLAHRGITFGVLRYLHEDAGIRETLRSLPRSEVSFNYLGQLDQVLDKSTLFALADESPGPANKPNGNRSHLIEVNAVVLGGALRTTWSYSRNLHKSATIEELAAAFMEALRDLIFYCSSTAVGKLLPPTVMPAGIAPEEIESALEQVQFEV